MLNSKGVIAMNIKDQTLRKRYAAAKEAKDKADKEFAALRAEVLSRGSREKLWTITVRNQPGYQVKDHTKTIVKLLG
jgi:hypothetical protein